MRFSKTVFLIAGIYGLIVLAPGYFAEKRFGIQFPPAITHPEFYYGFYGLALAWQVAFLIIAADPARLRGIIPAAVLEKLTWAVATSALYAGGRLNPVFAVFGMVDLLLGILFIICYVQLRRPAAQGAAGR
jgi:hypothetical protein